MSVRDEAADFKAAYLAEYAAYRAVGLDDRAEAVAAVLRTLGHDVKQATKEAAVAEPAPERAVEEPPRRRPGRPKKAEEAESDEPA